MHAHAWYFQLGLQFCTLCTLVIMLFETTIDLAPARPIGNI
jgi:hypothetical protein